MSHNLYTLNSVGGDVGSYHGSSNGFVYVGHGETATYPTGFVHLATLEFYDTNPINTITGATFTSRSGSPANWYNGVTVPAGTYIVETYIHLQASGAGEKFAGHCVEFGSNRVGCAINSPSESFATFYQQFPRSLIVQHTVTTSANIKTIVSFTATVTDTPIRFSECFGMLIRKLS